MDLKNTRTIILNAGDADAKHEEIRRYFHTTYSLDEQLYETLASEDAFYLRWEPLRHPLIFYLGHTAAFYINKLIVARITNQRINPRFESMFAVGVDETIRTIPLTLPIRRDHPFWVILMGIETSSVIIRRLCRSTRCESSPCGVSVRQRERRRRTNWCRTATASGRWPRSSPCLGIGRSR